MQLYQVIATKNAAIIQGYRLPEQEQYIYANPAFKIQNVGTRNNYI